MGIWRNIGKIVILLFQIVYEQMKYSFKRVKRNNPISMEALHNMSIPQQEKYNDRTKGSNIKTKDDITFI